MRRVVRGDQGDLHRPEPDRIAAPSTWSRAIARPMCLSGRTRANIIAKTRVQAWLGSRRTDKAPRAPADHNKGWGAGNCVCGCSRVGTNLLRAVAGKRSPLFERTELRLAGVSPDDEAVPGNLNAVGEEALRLVVTRLVRQVNQVGVARPGGLNDF